MQPIARSGKKKRVFCCHQASHPHHCFVFCIESLFPTLLPLLGTVSGTITESLTSFMESGTASEGGWTVDGSFSRVSLPPSLQDCSVRNKTTGNKSVRICWF